MHVETVVDNRDVDTLSDDALLPNTRHVDRVLGLNAVDEVPLFRPQRVEDAELGSGGRDQLGRRTAAGQVPKGPGGRRQDGQIALDAHARLLPLERQDQARVKGRGGPLRGLRMSAEGPPPEQVVPLQDTIPLALFEPGERTRSYARLIRHWRRCPSLFARRDLARLCPDQVVTLQLSDLLDVFRAENLCDIFWRPLERVRM